MENTQALSDVELITHLNAGDKQSFDYVYRKYQGVLYSHACRMLKDEDAALDAVQNVFMSLWERVGHISASTKLDGWLYITLRNQVIAGIRHGKDKLHYLDTLEQYEQKADRLEADSSIRLKQLTDVMELEISKLPPKMQQIFRMSREEYLSHKEIANKLSVSEGTVSQQISNALRILRSKLMMFFWWQIFNSILLWYYLFYK